MKKLVLYAAAALAVSFTGCKGTGTNANYEGFDTLFSQAKADTLLQAFGTSIGLEVNKEFSQYCASDSTLSKAEVVKGVQYILNADTTQSFQYGLSVGMFLQREARRLDNKGIVINRSTIANAFKRAFMLDSIDDSYMRDANATYSSLNGELNSALATYQMAKLQASPEAIANAAYGLQYIDSIAKANPGVIVTEAGVAVKADNQGEGEKIKKNDRVRMKYKVIASDGRVIESTSDEPRTVFISSRPEGFQEGMQQLANGATATIYVPGALAYGVQDARNRYGLGLNEMLIYEVEDVEVIVPESR